jgi:hypothetical protein
LLAQIGATLITRVGETFRIPFSASFAAQLGNTFGA